MGTWGPQFKRFNEMIGAFAPGDALAEGRAVAAALREIIHAAATAEGLVVYVPRRTETRVSSGAWIVDLDGDLELPRNVELVFAPGAALIPVAPPRNVAALVIGGVFTAPPAPVFATEATARLWRPELPGGRQVAPVRLTGAAIERVLPEWWGAGRGNPIVDTAALEAAIRAAHRDRRSASDWLRPLVVSLTGTYRLTRPLVIGSLTDADPAINPGGFELRGVPDQSSSPNLVCVPLSLPLDAVVVVRGVDRVRLDELRIDGGFGARACVSITLPDAGAEAGSHTLRNCQLRRALEHLLRVERRAAISGGRPNAVLVEGGQFTPTPGPMESVPGAVWLRALPTDSVDFRAVSFVGDASAMIHVISAKVSVSQCYFRNDRVPWSVLNRQDLTALHGHGPEGGVDVFLDSFDGSSAPASLSVMHCTSNSLQFLVARGATPTLGSDSTITGLRHEVRSRGLLSHSIHARDPDRRPPVFEVIFPQFLDTAALTPGLQPTAPIAPRKQLVPDGDLAKRGPDANEPSAKLTEKEVRAFKAPSPAMIGDGSKPPIADRDFTAAMADTVIFDGELPPVIDWVGQAQGGAGLVLCGCRFARASGSMVAPVRGRTLVRPIVDLGVQWLDPRDTVPLISVAGGGTAGVSSTQPETRTVPSP